MSRPATFIITTLLGLAATTLGMGMLLVLGPQERGVLLRTAGLGLGASSIALPLGILLWWVSQSAGWISRVMRVAVVALLLLPMVIHVSSWDAAFGKLGWLAAQQGNVLTPLISGWSAAIWIHGTAAAPQVAFLLLIASNRQSQIYEEQALLDTTAWQAFLRITLPRFFPLLLMSVLWIMISCAREIAVTDLYQIGTLAEQIYLGYSLDNGSILGNWSAEALASASNSKAWLSLAMVTLFSVIGLILFLFLTALPQENAAGNRSMRPLSGYQQATAIGLLLILVAVPIANVLARSSFFVLPVDGQPTQQYSVWQIARSINRASIDYADEITWSTLIAATSASIIVVSSFLIAWKSRVSKIWRVVLAIGLAISCALPGPLIGSTLASWFSNSTIPWFHWLTDYTIFGPVVASTLYCWPVGGILIWFLLRRIPQDLLDSATLEGSSSFQRAWAFGWVAHWPSLIGCWLILFSFSFGELSASQMVRPAGMDTAARKMLGDLHAGVNELTAGITIVIAGTVTLISLLGWAMIWLNSQRMSRQ